MKLLRAVAVSQCLELVRSRKIHEHFIGYLCVLRTAASAGTSKDLRPDFKAFCDQFLSVKGASVQMPYVRMFTQAEPSPQNQWANKNPAGSFAPSSLRPNMPFSKVVSVDRTLKQYSLPANHADLALAEMCFGEPLPAFAIAAFFYRDYGLVNDNANANSYIDIFREEFALDSHTFEILFTSPRVDVDGAILEVLP